MEEFKFSVPIGDKSARAMMGKLKRGKPVQIPSKYLMGDSPNVKMNVASDKLKKIMRSMKQGRGVRIQLSPDECSTLMGDDFSYTTGGRIKSLKELNRDTSKAFKKAGKKIEKGLKKTGEELKKVPKYYRKNVRQYTSPIAKVLIEQGIPEIGSKLVEEGMKAMDVPAPVAKLAGKATKAGLKKPSQMAYKKSGLGLKSDMKKLASAVKKTGKKAVKSSKKMAGIAMDSGKKMSGTAMDYLGSGVMKPAVMPPSALMRPAVIEPSPIEVKPLRGRMPRSAGMGIRYKDISVGDHMLPPVVYGGEVNMGRLISEKHGSYTPYQTASTPMMPLGSGLYAGGRGLY